MAHILSLLPQSKYGQQWGVCAGIGSLSWFLGVSFARVLPAPLQLLTMLVPVGCFTFALTVLPKWQKEGRHNDLVESLKERERSHLLMNRHFFNLAAMDVDHNQVMSALSSMYGNDAISVKDEPQIASTPQHGLPLADKENYLLQVQQEVMQVAGPLGWSLIEYVTSKGSKFADSDGWIPLEKLRSNWGRNLGLNTEQLRQLVNVLNSIQIAEWKDANLKDCRLLLTV